MGRRAPRYARAWIQAFQVSAGDPSELSLLTAEEWRETLRFADRAQVTLMLGNLPDGVLPEWVASRVTRNRQDFAVRFARLKQAHREISGALDRRGIEFVTLKGFTHVPDLTPYEFERPQGDIDLWFSPGTIGAAYETLVELGYRSHGRSDKRHLSPMIRETNWAWRGDYWAPELPVAVELHYRLWDADKQLISGAPEQEFWARRVRRIIGGEPVTTLSLADTVAFANLHLLMHVLAGELPLQRAWEIARFVHCRGGDGLFWRQWRDFHPEELRRLETIAFSLTAKWFGCEFPEVVAGEAEHLSPDVRLWLEKYGWSPFESLFHPNKDELWLNLALLPSWRRRVQVLAARLLPMRAAGISNALHAGAQLGAAARWALIGRFLLTRATRHASTIVPAIAEGVRWWWLRQRLGGRFLQYQATSALFNFGAFIFFLLYNLFLLDLGYREDTLGRITSVLTAGAMVGSIPAGMLARRYGLRTALLTAALGGSMTMMLRSFVIHPLGLLAGAFLNGVCLSMWAVSLAPAVADFTGRQNRALAFSLVSSLGIATGVAASLTGGHLPGAFQLLFGMTNRVLSERWTLLTGAVLVALAAIPATRLKFSRPQIPERSAYPRTRFVARFLVALAAWSFGTGLFNPFANAYLSRVCHLSVASIGMAFSFSQLLQVAGILGAPALFRRLGELRGIALTQIAAAGMLGLLGLASSAPAGILLYACYMCFQYANEPGLFTLLMSGVRPEQRTGASALQFLTASLIGILSALAGGKIISNFGYGMLFSLSGVLAAGAAGLFLTFRQAMGASTWPSNSSGEST